ncbi:MAG TPA: hypothetical protein VF037_04195 [Gemmatimonadales bacterium]
MRRLLPFVLAALLGGCAYYNAMYNARRLTGEAEKAEREGRTFDANTLWGQVTVKAETVIARHPDSKYAPEAYALIGRAHVRLRNCTRARPALEAALGAPLDSVLAIESELRLAQCYTELGHHQQALARYEHLLAVGGPTHRQAALIGRARALRSAGRPDEAVSLVEANPGLPPVERLSAYAAAGRGRETLALADSLVAARDSSVQWDSVIGWLAARDRDAASTLVDRTAQAAGVTPAAQARRLLADAARFTDDPPRARARYAQARDGRGMEISAAAGLATIRLDLREAEAPEDLAAISLALTRDVSESSLSSEGAVLQAAIDEIGRVVDSTPPGTPQGDMRTFLAAELARDRLGAPKLAAQLFARVPDGWPESPYAPKAMLAAAQLLGDTLLARAAEARYPESPYLLASGGAYQTLRALEDSLGAFAAQSAARRPDAPRRPAGARPGPDRAGTPAGPVR